MKTKLFKRIGALGVSTLAVFAFASTVKAAGQCEYTNYYFFNLIENVTFSRFDMENNSGTYFPRYLENNLTVKEAESGKVCLKNSSNPDGDGTNCTGKVWDLSEFYTMFKRVKSEGEIIKFTDNENKTSEAQLLTTTDSDGNVTRYYVRGYWYKTDDNEWAEGGSGQPTYFNLSNDVLVSSSYLPDTTELTYTFPNNLLKADIKRVITQENWNTATSFTLPSGMCSNGCKLAPALLKVVYTADCQEEPKFDANIHYCIEQKDGTCTPATDVDKNAKDYSETGLANGTKVSKESYTIKNCKLKNDDDKTVEHTINNDNFDYTVRYICGEEAAPVNPKTGIALIIAAWVVGLGALGYSAYYFMNARKEENAEL